MSKTSDVQDLIADAVNEEVELQLKIKTKIREDNRVPVKASGILSFLLIGTDSPYLKLFTDWLWPGKHPEPREIDILIDIDPKTLKATRLAENTSVMALILAAGFKGWLEVQANIGVKTTNIDPELKAIMDWLPSRESLQEAS